MEVLVRSQVVELYLAGHSVREIADLLGGAYGREAIRLELKNASVPLRGRGVKYKTPEEFSEGESVLFAELLGYLYGDGHLSKVGGSKHGRYESVIALSLDEGDVVRHVMLIVGSLFGFEPRVVRKNYYRITLRRSLARYLHRFGFPVGKKSVLNPCLPLTYLVGDDMKKAFLRGFFNAEASVHKSVSVHQSVRVSLDDESKAQVMRRGMRYLMRGSRYHICSWRQAGLSESDVCSSNILLGVQTLLKRIGIPSMIYPVRFHVSGQERVSLHYELRIGTQSLKKVADFRLVSSRKKTRKLHSLMRVCPSGQIGAVDLRICGPR